MPRLLEAFEKGVPHKVAADPLGRLVFFGYTEVGLCCGVVLGYDALAALCVVLQLAMHQVGMSGTWSVAVRQSFLQPPCNLLLRCCCRWGC